MERSERPEYFTTNKNQVQVEFLKSSNMNVVPSGRYIRTKSGEIFDTSKVTYNGQRIFKQSDFIEYLCDGFILVDRSYSYCRKAKNISYRFFNWVSSIGDTVFLYDEIKDQTTSININRLREDPFVDELFLFFSGEPFTIYGYTIKENDEGGITLVAKFTKKGEFELL